MINLSVLVAVVYRVGAGHQEDTEHLFGHILVGLAGLVGLV